MKNPIFKLASVGALTAFSLIAVPADAALSLNQNSNIIKNRQKVIPVRDFKGQKPWGYDAISKMNLDLMEANTRGAINEPDVTFNGLETFDFLEGPNNTTWFYTVEFEKDYYEVSEWYTEEIIKAYTFTVYDNEFKEVGKITDKIHLEPGETKIVYAALDPCVTQFFFNDDDNVEIMVYLAVNTDANLGYEVHYYNKIYSVNGEKDEEGYDICIDVLPGRCVDTLNTATNGENFILSFVEDVYPDVYDFDDYIDYINSVKTVISVYTKDENGNYDVAFTKDIYMARYPGDTTEGIYMITYADKGTPYFVFSQYEKPYFVDPTGFATDESATPDNNLLIETCIFENGILSPVSTTRIPVEVPIVEGQIAYYFYSIGSVGWKGDIDTKVNGTINAPAYIVARDFTTAANPDDITTAYFVYGNDGNVIHTLAAGADSIYLLNSADNDQPHALFVNIDDENRYSFDFVDLYSGEKYFTIDQDNDGDPLTAICQRIKGADGKYKYAFEMEFDDLDTNDNDIKRIAWFNQDGTPDRIDYINMGKNVMYATINTYPECLDPYLFDNDDAMEYAVLVKRAYGNTTRNEFLIADENGDFYAQFTSDDGKGSPVMFSILPGIDLNCLQMVYVDGDKMNVDIYYLPFVSVSGVESIIDKNNSNIRFDGDMLHADGVIEVYTAAGVKVAEGLDAVSLKFLTKGIYVAKVTGADGKTSSIKIAK